jgi:hypothetical protein
MLRIPPTRKELWKIEPKNRELLIDAITDCIKIFREAGETTEIRKLIQRLVTVHRVCGNHLEEAKTCLLLLDYMPCDLTEPPKSRGKTYVEFHISILKRCVNRFMEAGYDEFALEAIERIRNTCVFPFGYFEVMTDIGKLETELYGKISSTPRLFSRYYMVGFYGGLGVNDELFTSRQNRVFIYRRSVDMKEFEKELHVQFPNSRIDVATPTESDVHGDRQYIHVLEVTPVYREEVDDPYFEPPSNELPYHVAFRPHRCPYVFRYEEGSLGESGSLRQTFFRATESFPALQSRVEIGQGKDVVHRSLNPIQRAILVLRRQTFELAVSTVYIHHLSRCNQIETKLDEVWKFLPLLKAMISEGINGRTVTLAERFLAGTSASAGNDNLAETLRREIRRQSDLVEVALNFNGSVMFEVDPQSYASAVQQFGDMKKILSKYIGEGRE